MTRTGRILGLVFLAAMLTATSPAAATTAAVDLSATGTFDLSGCPISASARTCTQTPLKVLSGMPNHSNCTIAAVYDTVGAQEGLCSISDGAGHPASAAGSVTSSTGCSTLRVGISSRTETFKVIDSVGDHWTLLRMQVFGVHQYSSGIDHWVIDPMQSSMSLQNRQGRIMNLANVTGELHSTANCASNLAAASFSFVIEGFGSIF